MGSASQQGPIWGARARDWAEANEPAWTGVFEAVMEHAGAGRGRSLLDVGCGAGGALTVARARGARVAGLDASDAMVRLARARLPGAVIETGDMEALPFRDESFDVVTGLNSFQFAERPVSALRDARRVLRGGGTVAVLVWGPREHCDMLSRVLPALVPLLPPDATAAPRPALSEPGVIADLMDDAGLRPCGSHHLAGRLEFPDLDTATRAVLSASARAIAHSGEAPVRDALRSALAAMVTENGSVQIDNRFRLVLGRRPA